MSTTRLYVSRHLGATAPKAPESLAALKSRLATTLWTRWAVSCHAQRSLDSSVRLGLLDLEEFSVLQASGVPVEPRTWPIALLKQAFTARPALSMLLVFHARTAISAPEAPNRQRLASAPLENTALTSRHSRRESNVRQALSVREERAMQLSAPGVRQAPSVDRGRQLWTGNCVRQERSAQEALQCPRPARRPLETIAQTAPEFRLESNVRLVSSVQVVNSRRCHARLRPETTVPRALLNPEACLAWTASVAWAVLLV